MDFQLTGLTPMLETPDVQGTIEFYTTTLGFVCKSYSEEHQWTSLNRDGISIMFSAPNAHRNMPAPIMSGSIYFTVDDVEATWRQLKDRCKVCYPIENFPYGMREFAIFDNNGYLLQFGQRIEGGWPFAGMTPW